jgi:hypothetical protein
MSRFALSAAFKAKCMPQWSAVVLVSRAAGSQSANPHPWHGNIVCRGNCPVCIPLICTKLTGLGTNIHVVGEAPQSFEREIDRGAVVRIDLISGKAAVQVVLKVLELLLSSKLVHYDLERTRCVR